MSWEANWEKFKVQVGLCWAWASSNVEWRNGLCLWQIWKQTDPRILHPELYLGAWIEVFIIMLMMSWIATIWFIPEVIDHNRINDLMGYNNVCVGFDEAPARYVAMPGMVLMSYFGIRYVSLDNWRAKLEFNNVEHTFHQKKNYYISFWANNLFAFTMLFWPMLLVITPGAQDNWSLSYHFYIYVLFVVIMFCNILANFIEAEDNITLWSKIWLYAYAADTLGLLGFGFIAFNSYDYSLCNNVLGNSPDRFPSSENYNATINQLCEQEPTIPIFILGFFDYAWFLFLAMTPVMIPDAPAIVIKKVDLEEFTLENDKKKLEEEKEEEKEDVPMETGPSSASPADHVRLANQDKSNQI